MRPSKNGGGMSTLSALMAASPDRFRIASHSDHKIQTPQVACARIRMYRGTTEPSRRMETPEPGTHQIGTPRLFDLSEYDSAFGRFVYQAINELMIHKSPLLSRIKAVPSSNIPVSRNTMPSGEVLENEPIKMEMPFPVDFNSAARGDLSAITASIDAAAEAGLGTLMPQFYDYFGRLCEAAGTATDANGEKLSHSLILKSFEKMDIEFDQQGRPEMPTLVTTPATFDAIRVLPPPTQAEKDAWDAMIERKRKEFNDRRRHRQLS